MLLAKSFVNIFSLGGILPGRNFVSSANYKYQYQGQEKDIESGLTNFELRQFDPRLGRWFNPDPFSQYHSPYLAMGNNPVSFIDPSGGYSYFDEGSFVNLFYSIFEMVFDRTEVGEKINFFDGIYIDRYGNEIGKDDKLDKNIYLVDNSNDEDFIKANDKAGKETSLSELKNPSFLLPTYEEREKFYNNVYILGSKDNLTEYAAASTDEFNGSGIAYVYFKSDIKFTNTASPHGETKLFNDNGLAFYSRSIRKNEGTPQPSMIRFIVHTHNFLSKDLPNNNGSLLDKPPTIGIDDRVISQKKALGGVVFDNENQSFYLISPQKEAKFKISRKIGIDVFTKKYSNE